MTRSRNKHLEEQISTRLMILHEDWNSKDMKFMAWITIIE